MASKPSVTARAIPSADAYEGEGREGPFIGGFEVVKTIREHIGIRPGGGGTFGSALDAHLLECAKRHEEVRSITLEINEDHWHNIAREMRGEQFAEG